MKTKVKTVQQLLEYSRELQIDGNKLMRMADEAIKEAEYLILQDSNTEEIVRGCFYNPN